MARPINVLIVEDGPSHRLLIRKAFDKAEINNSISEAEDGIDGLDFIYKRGKYIDRDDKLMPGLILLDLNMPRMDGHEMLAALKSNDETKHIPVIVLTTSGFKDDINRSYKLGANSYLCKPDTNTELVEKIKSLKLFWYLAAELPSTDGN